MGEVRSPRFRRLPFMRNGVSDHGRAVTPCIAVHNILPSTLSTAVSVAGETFLIAGAVAGLLPLDAQALHSVFLVGDNLSGKR